MRPITARQERVLRFIRREVRQTGQSPSYRAIAAHLGVDVRSAYQHVEALENKGVLERSGREIRLLGEYAPPPGVPILGRVAAGIPTLAAENVEGHVKLADLAKDEKLFMLRVKGDSMTGAGIHDGDLVMARAQERVENGQIAVVVIGDEATVKRVHKLKNGLRLDPENNRYKPITIGPEEEVRIAGKVLMAMREV